MPSRPIPPSSPSSHKSRVRILLLALTISSSTLLLLALLILLIYLYFSLLHRRSPTLPFDSSAPLRLLHRFSYRDLRSATAAFDPSRRLGRGGSASVFRGVLRDGKSVAVKKLDLASPSDREFQNELQILGGLASPFVVSLVGYCIEKKRRLLVYEYMPNGSLQEALFGSESGSPVLDWDRRFRIIQDVAQGLQFLHLECDPPVIHGDIKPSNVLLGSDFRAKISDFGLSRIKAEAELGMELFSQELGPSQELWKSQELVSGNAPVSPKVDFALALRASSSSSSWNMNSRVNPYGNVVINDDLRGGGASPKGKETVTMAYDDEPCSVDHSRELNGNGLPLVFDDANNQWGKDWWWKQDGSSELCSKDYVREWIGSQICPSTNPDWDDERKNSPEKGLDLGIHDRVEDLEAGGDKTLFGELGFDSHNKPEKKAMMGINGCEKKHKKMKEWWKEEYFAEISRKGKYNKGLKWFRTNSSHNEENNNGNDIKRGRNLNMDISFRKGWKKKSRSVGSGEMWSGDLFSRELSSTTSMRGTVCYVAPEYSGFGYGIEKADIYSLGVLILVIVSGRRPLHVLSSPMKLEKANLISWCRQLAQTRNVLELMDERLKDSYDRDQVTLCINLALLCLQRVPELRPDAGDIVKILKGEMDLPVIPFEFSPSPRSKLFSRSRRKTTSEAE